MANQIQKVIYEGFLVAEPDMRLTPNGKAVTNFRMGSNRTYKDSEGNPVKEVTWLKVTAWGKLAEIVDKYCDKGSQVVVEGRLRVGKDGNPSVYELNSGGHGASYEITAESIRILRGKDMGSEDAEEVTPINDDEIPF